MRDKVRLLSMTRFDTSLGAKPTDGKTMFDEPVLFIDLFEAQNKLVDNFQNKSLESNIRWLLGFENYINDKRQSECSRPRFRNYSKGTIVFVDFFGNFGNEFTYDHPAVVLKENRGLLVVAPLTSNQSIYNDSEKYHIKLESGKAEFGNRKINSTILLEQLRTISKNRIIKGSTFGRISNNEKLKEIDLAVINYLSNITFESIKNDYEATISEKDLALKEKEDLINDLNSELIELKQKLANQDMEKTMVDS